MVYIEYRLMEQDLEGYKAYGIVAIQENTVVDYVADTVSYTHLDVYKRQELCSLLLRNE